MKSAIHKIYPHSLGWSYPEIHTHRLIEVNHSVHLAIVLATDREVWQHLRDVAIHKGELEDEIS